MPQGWYGQVTSNLGKIAECISFYEEELEKARVECGLTGNIEKNATKIPGIVEHRFNQLQEIEAILEFLNIQLRKIRSIHYKKFLETYKDLTSRDVEKYNDAEDEVVSMTNTQMSLLLRNKSLDNEN